MSSYSDIDVRKEVNEAKDYAALAFEADEELLPRMTLYRGENSTLTVTLPAAPTPEDRLRHLRQVAFLPSVFGATAARIIINSRMKKSTLGLPHDTEDEDIGALLVIFSTGEAAFMHPYPYIVHPDDNKVIWQQDQITLGNGHDFLNDHPALLSFCGTLFFMEKNTLPASSYLNYLLANDFSVAHHHPWTVENYELQLTPTR